MGLMARGNSLKFLYEKDAHGYYAARAWGIYMERT